MRKQNKKFNIILLCVIAVLIIGAVVALIVSNLADQQVSNKISIQEAQKIVDTTFSALPVNVADSAKLVIEKTDITVEAVEYGYEKDVILTCSYTTINTKDALVPNLDSIATKAYEITQNKGSNQVGIRLKAVYAEYLSQAETISGKITLYIYETNNGLQLYLTDDIIDTCTGGLKTVLREINSISEVTYEGQTINVTNDNTLRTGIKYPIDLSNYSTEKPFTGNWIENAWNQFKGDFYRNFVQDNRYMHLVKGLGNTLAITGLAALLGIAIGFLIAIVRCTNQMTGKLKLIDGICRLYLTVIRGTPVMVQLIILFFVVFLPIGVDKFTAAVICFGMNSGAYVAEIVRGGIMSIDKGQIEAGRSLGFNYVQTMVLFVIPQAFKAILPSLANEFITLLKESSVAFYIGVADLTKGGLTIRSITFSTFMPLIAVAVIYLALVLILTKLVSILERRLAKSDH